MSFNLKGLLAASLTDEMYANSLASFFSDKTEYAQERISEISHALMLSEEDAESYIQSLPSAVKNKLVPYFPNDASVESSLHRFEDLIRVHSGLDSADENLTPDMANAMVNSIAGSTASLICACVGIKELCNKVVVGAGDVVGAIEAQVGSVSDEMLGTLSVIVPILSSESMALRDKVNNILGAFGFSTENATAYSGFGPVPSTIYDMTGLAGWDALIGTAGESVQNVGDWLWSVACKVGGFIDRLFGNIFSKAITSVENAHNMIWGRTDAVECRPEGEYTDITCDNGNFAFVVRTQDLTNNADFLLGKLSEKYAMHITLGFGVLDLWYKDSAHDVVNCVIHWKPCNAQYCLQALYDHAIIEDRGGDLIVDWMRTDSGVLSLYYRIGGWLFEMETPQDVEYALEFYSELLTSQPDGGDSGVWNSVLSDGIMMTQCLFFGMLHRMYMPAEDPIDDAIANLVGFKFGNYAYALPQNLQIALMAGMSTYGQNGSPFFLHLNNANYFAEILRYLLEDISLLLASFDFDNPTNMGTFIPYIYISSYASGKYHIITDSELTSKMKNMLIFVGSVVVAIISIKIILSIKKAIWIRQASLDYRAFEVDVATDGAAATALYSEAMKLSRAQNVLTIIIGSAKTAAIKGWQLLAGVVNGISGRITGLISNGNQGASPTTSLDQVGTAISNIKSDTTDIKNSADTLIDSVTSYD